MNSIMGNDNEYIGVLKYGKHQMESVFYSPLLSLD